MHDKQNRITVDHPRIYKAWDGMISRCIKEKTSNYERYGAKGITVCEEWIASAGDFVDWALSNGYNDTLELDRIDYTKGYSPENCRWVNEYIQAQNKGISKNNTTGVKGVSYVKRLDKYKAEIMRFGVRLYLGCFPSLEEASLARKKSEESFAYVTG